MTDHHQHTPYSLLDDQRSFSSLGSSDRMSIYDYFTLSEEQPPLNINPSTLLQGGDSDLLDLSRCESSLVLSDDGNHEDCDHYLNTMPSPDSLIEQSNQVKTENQDIEIAMIADERAAMATHATIMASVLASLSNAEIQELRKEKEEFSLLAKKKITGAAKYKKDLESALLKVEAVNAECQSLRSTTQKSQKAITELTKRLGSNEKTIIELTRRLEATEAENRRLRARADMQKDINKDVKAAIRNLQG